MVPLAVAVGVMHDPSWVPVFDDALIEMHVRDVGGSHTPLLGLGGRLRGFGMTGSHPGPMSFYLLAPVYRLAGASSWSLLVAAGVASSVAAGLAVWLGYRRGGWQAAIVVGSALALLFRAYGAWRLVDPWNPHQPLAWWIVYLLAVWSVVCGDVVVLPVAVFAGSYCAQTHIPYAGPVAGLGLLIVGSLVWQWRRDEARSRRWVAWTAASAGVAVLLWLPPLAQQVTNHPGNLSVIVENFSHPYDQQVSFGDAFDDWRRHLDIGALLTSGRSPDPWSPIGHVVAGTLWFVAWIASAGLTIYRLRHDRRSDGESTSTAADGRLTAPAVARLHLVVAVAAGLGLTATARIFGPLFPYLVLWGWGTAALMVAAMACTLLLSRPTAIVPIGTAAAVVAVLLTIDAAHSHMPLEPQQRQLAAMLDDTTAALRHDPPSCDGHCRYAVSWDSSVDGTAEGIGLLNALRRAGFDAGPTTASDDIFLIGHTVEPADADATIRVATGDALDDVPHGPGVRQLAHNTPTSPTRGSPHPPPAAIFLIPRDRPPPDDDGQHGRRARQEGTTWPRGDADRSRALAPGPTR